MNKLRIEDDDLTRPEVQALLREHLENLATLSPVESMHALDIDQLRQPDVTFWTVWSGPDLLACGALRQLSPSHGEIKSMRTAAAHQRRGAARALLRHILDEARRRSYQRLSLETGTASAFEPAHRLYESFGFEPCGPFGEYVEDPNCRYFSRELSAES
jgi:putative acetyltransferase